MPDEFRHVIRLSDTNIDGSLKMIYALKKVKGVGIRLASTVLKNLSINPDRRIGFLSDAEIKKIEETIKDTNRYNVPSWLLNRSRDVQTGIDKHLIGSDLVFQTKTDIENMKKVKSWRGFRHAYGLKVRGQRTRTTARRGKSISVRRKRRQER
jgi:small subunit ribosomal protein S13